MKYINTLCLFIALGFLGLFCADLSLAKEGKSSKVIDFESEVVEGMNKRPLDSLSHISDEEKRRRRPHLYKKRAGFKTEIADTLRLARYTK